MANRILGPLVLVAIAAWPTPGVGGLVLAGLGLGNAVEDVAGLMLLHRLVPDHHLRRALGALWGAAGARVAVGSLAAPVLSSVSGCAGRWA